MQCTEFEYVISEQAAGQAARHVSQQAEAHSAGQLPVAAALHLESCGECRLLWDDLGAIRAAAREWGLEEPSPSTSLWPALRAQLESEGVIRAPRAPASAASAGWFGWLGLLRRPALVVTYSAVLLLAAALVNLPVHPVSSLAFRHITAANSASLELGQTLDRDMKTVMAALPAHDPEVTDSLEHNLGIVDNFISVCQKSVREHPDNPVAREYLYGAYQQKAVLLATAIDRSSLEDR